MARHLTWQQEQTSFPNLSIATSSYSFYKNSDSDEMDESYDGNTTPQEDPMWEKFFLHTSSLCTPPCSPHRDEVDEPLDYSDLSCLGEIYLPTMPTSELFDCELTSVRPFKNPVLQDCMWSGAESRTTRVRNVSLSELNMVSTSTSCIDPTTFTAYPRQHNQVEHNYSLATPEPMRVKLYSDYNTPSTSENSESEEDVIDVVTVDATRLPPPTHAQTKSHSKTSVFRVRQNLHQVAKRLSTHPYKRPKCLATSNIMNTKKQKQFMSSPNSLASSLSGSDCEEYGVKRSAHNVMERRRRSELREHLHKLRDQLPMDSERPAKVMILVRATHAIQQYEAQDRALKQEYKVAKTDNIRLKQRLAELQAQFESSF